MGCRFDVEGYDCSEQESRSPQPEQFLVGSWLWVAGLGEIEGSGVYYSLYRGATHHLDVAVSLASEELYIYFSTYRIHCQIVSVTLLTNHRLSPSLSLSIRSMRTAIQIENIREQLHTRSPGWDDIPIAVKRWLKDFVSERRRTISGQTADGLSPRNNSARSRVRETAFLSVENVRLGRRAK